MTSDLEKRELRILSFEFQKNLAAARAKIIVAHGVEVYKKLTNNWVDMVRLEELIYTMSESFPGLAPTRTEVAADSKLSLPNKQGYELSQGMIIGELLANKEVGTHLMAVMRMPKKESLECLEDFINTGEIEMQTIKLVRDKNVARLTLTNPTYLNAEDDTLNTEMELAVDLILLDPSIDIAVIRGGFMDHKKYQNKRVFCSGINLTKLYSGELSYMFYVAREVGLVSKIYRGLFSEEYDWNQAIDRGIEKPFISAVDTHAIGGGCQLVLVSDIVIAESNAYFTIPARTEGFIPGLANLRSKFYMGQRLAKKMINLNYKLMADSPEGKLLVDEVVEANEMDEAIDRIIKEVTSSGVQGLISNRKAFRVGAEPLELFRNYMAMFSQEQVGCMYNSEIIENLESFWIQKKEVPTT